MIFLLHTNPFVTIFQSILLNFSIFLGQVKVHSLFGTLTIMVWSMHLNCSLESLFFQIQNWKIKWDVLLLIIKFYSMFLISMKFSILNRYNLSSWLFVLSMQHTKYLEFPMNLPINKSKILSDNCFFKQTKLPLQIL